MDPLHHHPHHHHHHHAPLHWGYSATGHPAQHNAWVPPPTTTTTPTTNNNNTNNISSNTSLSTRKLKRAISESDCEDLYSEEESSKEQTSPGESDSCHMMSRKKRRGVIEKKRRDRINLSLCELKRLVPSAYEKQGSAKLEKAEILQLTVDHLKQLHTKGSDGVSFDAQRIAVDYHIVGFRECATEVARYLVTMEGMDIQDPMRLRLMSHLQCFVAQRELQLKSNGSGVSSSIGVSDPLSPALPPAVGNPISPNMSQSTTNWATPTSYQQGYHQHHHHQQMMPTTYQQQQQQQQHNAYASQTAATQSSGGYVPNLSQYDQYGNSHSSSINARVEASYNNDGTTGNASSATSGGASTTSAGRSGVTTRSQANNTNNNQSTGTSNSSTSASSGNDVNGDQNGPTYTDLSSSSSAAGPNTVAAVAAVSSASSAASEAVAVSSVSSSVGAGNNRLNNNYNIYGHIHYPVDSSSFTGHHHHHHGYNLHLGSAAGSINGVGLQMDLSSRGSGGGYNVVPGNGNSKPYRPWGAEMAY